MSAALAIAGASIFLLLGVVHAAATLQSTPEGGPMLPTDPDTLAAMQVPGGLGLAPEVRTTLYRAWIGFNLSHSLGVIAVAGVVLTQVIADFGAAVDEAWFLALAALAPVAYFVLAVRYWFSTPRNGIAIGTTLLWLGIAIETL